MAHCDLVTQLKTTWDPFHFRILKVKSHRSLNTAESPTDLYTILGNMLADETAKVTNRQDLDVLLSITNNIDHHCQAQQEVLLDIYRYLVDLNALHSKIRLGKDKSTDGDDTIGNIDEIAS